MAGSYMDKQEAKLRQQMAGTGVEVVRKGDNLTLDMPGNVTFAFDSARLNPQFDPVLDKVGQTLVEYNKTVIQIAGHTDSTGSHAYNMKLSQERAASVKAYLEGRGVPAPAWSRSAPARITRSRRMPRKRAAPRTAASKSRSCR